MINVGDKIISLRKAKNWSQTELAKQINASRIMIGKYERNESDPGVDVLLRLAKKFDVSLDYLVGGTPTATFDKKMIARLEDIENLPQEEKSRIFYLIDLIIRDFKAKKAYS